MLVKCVIDVLKGASHLLLRRSNLGLVMLAWPSPSPVMDIIASRRHHRGICWIADPVQAERLLPVVLKNEMGEIHGELFIHCAL